MFINEPEVISVKNHREIVGFDDDSTVSKLGYCVFKNKYPADVIESILKQAKLLEHSASSQFLSLNHLRRAQDHILEVDLLMRDPLRLLFLSKLAGCELEPYPIPTAAAHINYYRKGEKIIDFHTDGCAFVELIPLEITGDPPNSATLVYNGPAVQAAFGSSRGLVGGSVNRLVQQVGTSVLLQGRRILHSADVQGSSERITLVLPMRSRNEPWKDDNTLFRLLQDDAPEDVIDHWIKDVVTKQIPAFKAMQQKRSSNAQ